MPGFYPPGRYDLAGFCVAVVEEDNLIDGRCVKAGDSILGIASSGVHSNGFSLVRKILERCDERGDARIGPEQNRVIDALLKPTHLYGSLVRTLLAAGTPIHAMAHITGGGIPENLPRCLPDGLKASVDQNSWPRPDLFTWLQTHGELQERDLWHTFNLGIGYCLVLPETDVTGARTLCENSGFESWVIGQVIPASGPQDAPVVGLPA